MHSIIVENLSNATFYSESDIWSAIDNFSASLANIKVASPYISNKVRFNWKVGDLLLIALSDINVRKGFVNPFVVEEVMNQGVKVYSNEKLHAKIYSNNERAVICSYNLSYASQNQWLEAGVLVTDTGNLEKVTAFFDDNLKDVNLVSKHRLTELKKLFEVDVKKSEEQTDAPYLKNNVWSVFLMDGEVLDRNLQTKVDYSINRTETQKNVFTYYHFRTTQNVFEIGDYIIQFKKIGGEMKIFFPARCIKIEPITDNLSLVHLAHKGNHVAIHWNQLKSSVLDLDLNPVHKKIEQKQKVLERLYHYFNL